MKSIYFDSFQIHSNDSDLGFFIRPPIDGLDYPTVRTSQYNRVGEHGAFLSNILYGGRRITLEGTVFATSEITFESRRRSLESAFAIKKDADGFPEPIVMKFTTMDDLALQVDVYVRRLRFSRTNLTNGRFFVDLYSPKFAIEAQNADNETITVPSGGGAVYPVIYPVTYGAETGGSAIVVNGGSAPAFPIITLTGSLSNPIIQNVTTGKHIELSMTIPGTQSVVIDMKEKTILLGSQSVIANKTSSSEFWHLETGDNTIKLLTSSSSDTGNAQVQWRDAYLGC